MGVSIGLEWTRDGASCLHSSALGPAPLRPSVRVPDSTMTREKIAIAVAMVGFLIVAGGAFWLWLLVQRDPHPCVEKSIGTFATRDAAESASLKMLSQQFSRYPTTELFRVYFDLSKRDRHGGGGATLYERKWRSIGFENDPGSGFIAKWTNVTEAAIQAAAATNGTFNSFGSAAWWSSSYYPYGP
jgi:hypothetical protein